MGPRAKPRDEKYFCCNPMGFFFFQPLILLHFYSLKNILSEKPCLGSNILISVVLSLTKLCRMEDKHVFCMPKPLTAFTACHFIYLFVYFYKALDLERKYKTIKRE